MKKTIVLMMALLVGLAPMEAKKKKADVITRAKQYEKMYSEQPKSIVIMPPINRTHHVEAKDYFYTTLYVPLCNKGYYVFPPMLTMDMFQTESAYDSELFIEGSLAAFREMLGVDAAMFTIIKDWTRNKVVGSLTAEVDYILRSTKTGETIYQRGGKITVDTSTNTGQGGLFGFIADAVATAISTSATDKVVAGRKCTDYVLSDLPAGPYSPSYGQDGDVEAGASYVTATVR